nr:RNA-directed DNA polymerase homolog [Tanacetum cinerariifolium]
MLERLSENKYYCFLDGFSRFFQIPIAPEDQEKTTFTCPYGTFAYRRMPFGLCNALMTFQRRMMEIFHYMVEDFMEVFMDDFSVFGAENLAADHLSRLENPNMGELAKDEITDKFLDEHLMILKAKLNEEEPWYADYRNYIVEKVVPPKWTPKWKNGSSLKTTYKTPTGCTPFRMVYGKACYLLVKIEHKAYWALKQCNMDLTATAKNRFMELNESMELRDGAYENTRIYKERTKRWHDSRLRRDKNFINGDKVLLFNSRLKLHLRKLKSKWVEYVRALNVAPLEVVFAGPVDEVSSVIEDVFNIYEGNVEGIYVRDKFAEFFEDKESVEKETHFANLDIWEFLRSNPSNSREDFFKARITEARFEIIAKEDKEHIVEKKINVILRLQGEFASPKDKGSLNADEYIGVVKVVGGGEVLGIGEDDDVGDATTDGGDSTVESGDISILNSLIGHGRPRSLQLCETIVTTKVLIDKEVDREVQYDVYDG